MASSARKYNSLENLPQELKFRRTNIFRRKKPKARITIHRKRENREKKLELIIYFVYITINRKANQENKTKTKKFSFRELQYYYPLDAFINWIIFGFRVSAWIFVNKSDILFLDCTYGSLVTLFITGSLR